MGIGRIAAGAILQGDSQAALAAAETLCVSADQGSGEEAEFGWNCRQLAEEVGE
jgi:hypothetical protein